MPSRSSGLNVLADASAMIAGIDVVGSPHEVTTDNGDIGRVLHREEQAALGSHQPLDW